MRKTIGLLLSLLLFGPASDGAALAQDEIFTNSLGMEFVLIPAGRFSVRWIIQNDLGEDIPRQRVVTISKPFYLGKRPVTQDEWQAVMGSNPADFQGEANPVEMVSWEDVQVFIQKLNAKEGGRKYRLPSEAEWEHASRAGSDTAWFFGDNPVVLGEYAWFSENSQNSTHPVGQKKPNPWGLYDIYGNVWEWVEDWYDDNAAWHQEGAVIDPVGPASGSRRVLRGGGWSNTAEDCRPASRNGFSPVYFHDGLGFRLAFSPGQ